MAQWRKVIVSGSNSELNNISSSGDFVLSKDGAKMKFGADNEVTLTHVHNDGLLLSDQSGIGTTKLQFGDAATFVQQQADGELGIDADSKIELTAPAVSMSNDLHVGGDIFAVGNITFQGDTGGNIRLGDAANDNLVVGADISSSLVPNNNDSFNLGSDAQRWNDLYLSGSISASGGAHDFDSDSTITFDSAAGTSIDAGAASNFSTTAGDLTVEAGANNAKVVIKGDNESGTAIHLDANQADSSVVDIDAGSLDIDARTTVAIDSTTSTTITTATTFDVNSTGAVTIDSDAATTIGGSSVDIDADGGAVTVNGTTGATFGDDTEALAYDGSGNVNFDAVALDIDASGAVTLDGVGISIDGTAASNVTVTGNDLTLSTATSGNVIVDSAGTVGVGTTNATAITIGRGGITTTINGDLDVNGTLTTIDSTNLQIKDRFVQVASGSVSSTNGGLIVNTTANGSGSAFYYDGDVDRWSLTGAGDTGHTDTTVTPRQFVTTVSQSAVPPSATPGDFGNSDASRRGMIHIQTADDADTKSVEGDIWIYS